MNHSRVDTVHLIVAARDLTHGYRKSLNLLIIDCIFSAFLLRE